MQIELLQIELRPRSNAQALDLGYALLRSHGRAAYSAWLALWLPLVAFAAVLIFLAPSLEWLGFALLWWSKPLIERAPLYVLSRKVFGTEVSWQEAVRAWPRQLGGDMFSLLTWKRPFCPGRGLAQPVWQLETARGAVARKRIRLLSGNNTGASAAWFGVVCAHLEVVLQLGLVGIIGIFLSGGGNSNPFALFAGRGAGVHTPLIFLAIYAVPAAIIGPIYTACCFTLYLNRRASLEAWDLELKLRQFTAPIAARPRRQAGVALRMVGALCMLASLPWLTPDAYAADSAADSATACTRPNIVTNTRSAFPTPQQVRVRAQLDALYATPELRGYECELTWQRKNPSARKESRPLPALPEPDLALLASTLKALLIAGALGLAGWLLYRYRDYLPHFGGSDGPALATEIAGLDIRAESLPPDVAASARRLWTEGRRRAALALLYRATLSRLVSEDRLALHQGNTEGDCLRLARLAQQAGRTTRPRLDVAETATSLWLAGAYANRWPVDAVLNACCDAWHEQFGQRGSRAA